MDRKKILKDIETAIHNTDGYYCSDTSNEVLNSVLKNIIESVDMPEEFEKVFQDNIKNLFV